MTPEKQDKTSELSKHWSPDSTLARNELIMKMTHPVDYEIAKSVLIINKCMLLSFTLEIKNPLHEFQYTYKVIFLPNFMKIQWYQESWVKFLILPTLCL